MHSRSSVSMATLRSNCAAEGRGEGVQAWFSVRPTQIDSTDRRGAQSHTRTTHNKAAQASHYSSAAACVGCVRTRLLVPQAILDELHQAHALLRAPGVLQQVPQQPGGGQGGVCACVRACVCACVCVLACGMKGARGHVGGMQREAAAPPCTKAYAGTRAGWQGAGAPMQPMRPHARPIPHQKVSASTGDTAGPCVASWS